MQEDPPPPWKHELDAIVGARHGGQVSGVLDRLQDLATRHPHVADIEYQLAWTLDAQGREAEARPHYEAALALGLPPNDHAGALIGLGSTLRNLGEIDRAAAVLESGRDLFPDLREFDAFLALVRHDQGRHAEALQLALTTLADTADDPGITAYSRALRHYADQLT